MKTFKYFFAVMITSPFLFISCSTVPLTGRSQLNMILSGEMLTMGYQQYDEFLNKK